MKKNVTHGEWLVMRWKTMIIFGLQNILFGMDTSVNFLTLFLYLQTVVNTSSTSLFYGITANAYFIASVVFPVNLGSFLDRSRDVRKSFLLCNTISIVGNVLYTLHYSPWLLVAGRFLIGTGSCLRPVISAEICRCYTPEKRSKVFAFMGAAFGFGQCVLPLINSVFANVNIHSGTWHLSYLNISGIYMPILYILIEIVSVFMLSNLSTIYDLKKEMSENKILREKPLQCRMSAKISKPTSTSNGQTLVTTWHVIKKLLTTFNTCFIILLGFFGKYLTNTCESWISMLIVDKMKWPMSSLNLVIAGVGICAAVSCLIPVFIRISTRLLYSMVVASLISMLVCQLVVMEQYYAERNKIFDCVLWITFCLGIGITTIADEVVLADTLGTMVSSSIQTLCEGVRYAMFRFGSVFAIAIAPSVFPYMDIIGFFHIILFVLLLTFVIIGRKSITNPVIIIFGSLDILDDVG